MAEDEDKKKAKALKKEIKKVVKLKSICQKPVPRNEGHACKCIKEHKHSGHHQCSHGNRWI